MSRNPEFQIAYRQLESRMKQLAAEEDTVFVPNIEPSGTVDFIFICMEPSLGGWAKNRSEALARLQRGFRNFLAGYDPMILHFCIQRYLCRSGQQYHMTDFSKGAMLVEQAGKDRTERYKKWYPLLKAEIDLLATGRTKIFAVGRKVEDHLDALQFSRRVTRLLHYSPRADRRKGLIGREDAFKEFETTVTDDDIVAVARRVIDGSNVPDEIAAFALDKVAGRRLTPSRLRLIFNYRLAFETVQPTISAHRYSVGEAT